MAYSIDSVIDPLFDAAILNDSGSSILPSVLMELIDEGTCRPTCVQHGSPPSYHFTMNSESDEISLRLFGRIEQFSLPPFRKPLIKRMEYLQQRVTINAPLSHDFGINSAAVDELLQYFSTLSALDTRRDNMEYDGGSLTFSNRVFVPHDYVHEQGVIPIPHILDPTGTLQPMATRYDLVHTEDNVVEYLRQHGETFSPITPASIRCGDVVEVRFSIVLFHGSHDTLVFKLVLRAIISHKPTFSNSVSVQDPPDGMPQSRHLKRKRVADTYNDVYKAVQRRVPTPDSDSDESDSSSSEKMDVVEGKLKRLRIDTSHVATDLAMSDGSNSD